MSDREISSGGVDVIAQSQGNAAQRFRVCIQNLRGYRRFVVAIAAGALSALAMAPIHLAPVLLVTLPVLLWLLEVPSTETGKQRVAARCRSAAIIGWCFGFGYHFAGLYWIGSAFLVEAEKFAILLPFAVTMMPAGLALFFAAAAAATVLVPDRTLPRILALSLALALAEWLRGHILTGFPWNVLGYALTWPLALMQSVSLVGIYGLTLIVVLVALVPLGILSDERIGRRGRLAGVVLPAVLITGLAVYGAIRLSAPPPPDLTGHRLRIVQPSIAQTDKWRPDKQREIFERHLALSLQAPDGQMSGLAGITHVVWAEAAMPFLPLNSPEALAAIARLLPDGVQLIAGALRVERRDGSGTQQRLAFNSTIVLDAKAKLTALYDKIHLVPFGEYLPFQQTLEAIGLEQLSRMKGGFQSGARPRVPMQIAGLPPIGMLICYEAIFPGAVVQTAQRPAALFNLTNDGWFGHSTGPFQHLHQSRARAVEEGMPLVRVANNGISAVIDAYGRIVTSIPLDVAGTRDFALPGAIAPPVYAHYGNVPFVVLFSIVALLLGAILMID